ncbi:MAG: hypothetical protein FWF91_03860 [Coriobacteriia bacterium]|nr:hypothetical protein [Coriobacteriia bacterium]
MVSIAIVALEKADKLIDLVASIIPQLNTKDEIIIVVGPPRVGAPSDMTFEIAEEIARQVPLVTVYTSLLRSRNACYELAIRSCRGTTVFLAEPGDYWMPDKVSTVLSTFSTSGVALVLHDATLYMPRQNNRSYPSLFAIFGAQGDLSEQQIRDSYVGSCIAFRLALQQFFLPFPKQIVLYDQWMGLVAEKYGGVALITKPLISKTVGDGTDTLSLMVNVRERHDEQQRLKKTLKKRQKELNLVLRQLVESSRRTNKT